MQTPIPQALCNYGIAEIQSKLLELFWNSHLKYDNNQRSAPNGQISAAFATMNDWKCGHLETTRTNVRSCRVAGSEKWQLSIAID
jgi:hypothetical protein